jgi:hypothetical protein
LRTPAAFEGIRMVHGFARRERSELMHGLIGSRAANFRNMFYAARIANR